MSDEDDDTDEIDRERMIDFLQMVNSAQRTVLQELGDNDQLPGFISPEDFSEPVSRERIENFLDRLSEPPSVTIGKITEHRPPGDGLDPTIEYALPISFDEIRPEHQPALTSWFTRFLDRTPDEIHRMLSEEWDSFEGAARTFRDHLLDHSPRSLVFGWGKFRLAMENDKLDLPYLSIAAPIELDSDQLELISCFQEPTLKTFCRHFTDVCLGLTPDSASFGVEANPVTEEYCPNCGAWDGGLSLYQDGCGNFMLLSKEGSVARWDHELSSIEKLFDDFGAFIDSFIAYCKSPIAVQKETVFWYGPNLI